MNHYDVLGVTADASPDEIKQAWRSLAKLIHPDGHGEKDEATRRLAEKKMAQVNEAYAILSDPLRRRTYDGTLGGSVSGPARPSAPSARVATVDPGGPSVGRQRSRHAQGWRSAPRAVWVCLLVLAAALLGTVFHPTSETRPTVNAETRETDDDGILITVVPVSTITKDHDAAESAPNSPTSPTSPCRVNPGVWFRAAHAGYYSARECADGNGGHDMMIRLRPRVAPPKSFPLTWTIDPQGRYGPFVIGMSTASTESYVESLQRPVDYRASKYAADSGWYSVDMGSWLLELHCTGGDASRQSTLDAIRATYKTGFPPGHSETGFRCGEAPSLLASQLGPANSGFGTDLAEYWHHRLFVNVAPCGAAIHGNDVVVRSFSMCGHGFTSDGSGVPGSSW